ncbi:MAG: alpha/beta hydrolase [Proteobacteria bacterium]|nr:alpha/beta hydrolase [Pseudomonadota bacterium]
MPTFVLIHGAWFGGWSWKETANELRRNGHEVYTPSLTGLGVRRHLMNDQVNYNLHVMDVIKVIIEEELNDVILCGHSYSGLLIASAAEHIGNRIKKLIFVDAFVPKEGKCLLDMIPEKVKHLFIDTSLEGNPNFIPPKDFNVLDPGKKALLTRRCSPHPINTFKEVVNTMAWRKIPHKYILAGNYPVHHQLFEERVRNNDEWEHDIIDCGHIMMVDKPIELAKSLASNLD